MGTSSDALGYLGARDMLTRFFVEDTVKDYLEWGRKAYRFRGHAEEPFWRWVCSWARACRKPSDLGFPDDGFELPPLVERETIIENATPREGMLFAVPARDMREQRQERRVTIRERCEAAARIVHAHDGPSVVWCHLNAEGDALAKMIDGGAQVCGSMSDEEKEEKLVAFAAGQIQRLVTKPKIGCFGLNWQHCCNVVTFPSHSWEQYYQAVRRCWRFGQTRPVTVTVVGTEGERGVSANLRRKADQADRMFAALTEHVTAALSVRRGTTFGADEQLPPWVRAA
jgi:superfamily II DNA or RNA helicase